MEVRYDGYFFLVLSENNNELVMYERVIFLCVIGKLIEVEY